MKKGIVSLFAFAVLTSAVSAQKMGVSLDAAPLVKGTGSTSGPRYENGKGGSGPWGPVLTAIIP